MGEIPKGEELKEQLFYKKESGWNNTDKEKREKIFAFGDEYMYFLDRSKTEREAVKTASEILEKNGFKHIEDMERLNPGDRVYYVNREKSIYIAVIGEEKLEKGLNIVGAYID